ncbi:unnamed protein product, partial [Pylaiella littoralis]
RPFVSGGDQEFWHLPHTHVGPHTSARGPRAEAKPLGSPEYCTSGASSPRFSDGRFVVQTWRRKMCETPPKPERLRLKTCRLFRRDGCSPRGMKSTGTTRMTSWLSTT